MVFSYLRSFLICPCHSHSHLLIPKFANFLLFPPACVARTICLCGSHHPPVRLAPSFVFLRLDSAFFYLQISFVFQTDSLHQFLFKACPPSGVRGLLTHLFPICPCGSHYLPVRLAPLAKLKSTNNLLFIFTLASTFLCLRFVIPSFIVRLLFVVEPL